MDRPRILIITGSLRAASFNRQLAAALAGLLQPGADVEHAAIGQLPHFNQDQEQHFPPAAVAFREQVAAADAVLFVTPEYNRSIPGVLKNAIDIGSRPYSQSVWAGKPAAVCGTSPGAPGTALAQQHLRNILAHLDMPVLGQPEVFLRHRDGLFDDQGRIADAGTADFLRGFCARLLDWIALHRR